MLLSKLASTYAGLSEINFRGVSGPSLLTFTCAERRGRERDDDYE